LPGESEEEFQELLDFVREQKFERLGCFEYSAEEGTLAAQMEGQISAKTIARRRREIMTLQRKISREQNRTYQGQRISVLVEGVSSESEHLLVGRHSGQSPEVDGVVYLNDGEAHPGEIVEVEITQTAEYDLVGHVARGGQCKSI
jgi:ribosomal protein S12 methylthiotransferase